MWLGRALLPELGKHGLAEGGRALDVGCGTGRAFGPLLRRGWRLCGCDLSPAMLSLAAEEGGGEVELHLADMRRLPQLGEFDLVLSLNDSVSYLLGADDLVMTLAGMRANLAKDGLLVFDVNSRSTYSTGSAGEREVQYEGCRWVWTGRGEVEPSIFRGGDRGRSACRAHPPPGAISIRARGQGGDAGHPPRRNSVSAVSAPPDSTQRVSASSVRARTPSSAARPSSSISQPRCSSSTSRSAWRRARSSCERPRTRCGADHRGRSSGARPPIR